MVFSKWGCWDKGRLFIRTWPVQFYCLGGSSEKSGINQLPLLFRGFAHFTINPMPNPLVHLKEYIKPVCDIMDDLFNRGNVI
jgi:hypothetical protein